MFDFEARSRGLENVTTAAESCALLRRLVDGQLVDRATSDAVLALLRDCQDGSLLARYLPVDVKLEHKSGWMEGVRADIGIVRGARTLIVAGLTQKQPSPEAARAALGILGWCAYRAAGAEVPPLPFEVTARA
jgi:beta-lactamase class A